MKSYFGSTRTFLYGHTLDPESASAISGYPREALRTVADRVIRSSRKIAVSFIVVGVALTTQVSSSGPFDFNIPAIETSHELSGALLKARLKKAREYLGITQDQLAVMLRISPSAIEKFEQGQTKEPTLENFNKYSAVVALAELYESAFGTRKFLVRESIHEPTPYYDDTSLLDFAGRGEDGIYLVVATERRKHA